MQGIETTGGGLYMMPNPYWRNSQGRAEEGGGGSIGRCKGEKQLEGTCT